jgi:hypothetical protein
VVAREAHTLAARAGRRPRRRARACLPSTPTHTKKRRCKRRKQSREAKAKKNASAGRGAGLAAAASASASASALVSSLQEGGRALPRTGSPHKRPSSHTTEANAPLHPNRPQPTQPHSSSKRGRISTPPPPPAGRKGGQEQQHQPARPRPAQHGARGRHGGGAGGGGAPHQRGVQDLEEELPVALRCVRECFASRRGSSSSTSFKNVVCARRARPLCTRLLSPRSFATSRHRRATHPVVSVGGVGRRRSQGEIKAGARATRRKHHHCRVCCCCCSFLLLTLPRAPPHTHTHTHHNRPGDHARARVAQPHGAMAPGE